MNGTKQKRARSGFPASAAQLDLIEDLARALARLIETAHYGIYHLVGEGNASRYDWAARILQLAGMGTPLARAKLADFQRASTPPRNGALANFIAANSLGIRLRPWQDALEEYFATSHR